MAFFECVGRKGREEDYLRLSTMQRTVGLYPYNVYNGRGRGNRDGVGDYFRYLYKLIVRLRGACCDLKWVREIRGLVFVGFAQQWPDHRGMCEPDAR